MVANAAKLTVAAARIALPPIPIPGETAGHGESLDHIVAGEDADDEADTWRAIVETVPASAARLTERSRLANRLLIGYVTAGALVLAVGAVAVLVRGHFFVPTLVTALLVALACGFRSRLYAERWCAWALLAAAVATPTGLSVRLCDWYPNRGWLILIVYLAAAVVAVLIVGATGQVRRVSPLIKWALELVDGAVVASLIPMLLWITGIYDLVRNIRF